jgi:hypothetical protein
VRQSQPTLLDVARHRVGLRKALKVLTYMLAWQIVRDELGHEPTVDEYSRWWKEGRATAFRAQGLFREAFPGEDTPSRILDLVAAEMDRRKGVASLGNLAVPGVVI